MKSTKSCLKALLGMGRPLALKMSVSCLIGVVRIAASLAFVWIGKVLVDIATGENPGELWVHVMYLFLIILTLIASTMGGRWWEDYFATTTRNSMREKAFRHVMESRWSGREAFHSADTVNRLEEDIRVVADILCARIPDTLVTMLQLIAACVYLYLMQPGLMWILLVIMPVAIVGSRLFFNVIRTITSHLRSTDAEVQKLMQESLQNRIVIKTLGSTERVMEKLGWLQEDVRKTTVKRLNYNAISRSFMGLGFRGGYAAAFLWGVFGIRSGAVTYGMMTAFLQLVNQVQGPFVNLSLHVPAFIHALTSVERIMELEELPLVEQCTPVLMPGAPGIRVADMSFRYEDEPDTSKLLYKDFSYDFEPGQVTVIMGITGAGKSTLTKLLLGLLRPVSGKVELYSPESGVAVQAGEATMCNFMYVPQGGSLVSGSIRDNLLLVKPDATDDELRRVLSVAVADFVWDLPAGLDTQCTERGSGLSEGQAQRIAIARALLHSGGIIILDEATSALDSATEKQLLENLNNHFGVSKTVIWITHRESVTSFADHILRV